MFIKINIEKKYKIQNVKNEVTTSNILSKQKLPRKKGILIIFNYELVLMKLCVQGL